MSGAQAAPNPSIPPISGPSRAAGSTEDTPSPKTPPTAQVPHVPQVPQISTPPTLAPLSLSLSRSTSRPGKNGSPGSNPTVLSRLAGLFQHEPQVHHHSPLAEPPVTFPATDDLDIDIAHVVFGDDEPPTPPPKPEPIPDRDALKVLVVTWNMGDALPKGDLSVLLGDVPAYEPTIARDAVEGLPKLPVENVHPYHVVVFAAQECPTPSGVPRGLGGGLMKGVGLQKSEAYRREREKELGKEGKECKEGKEDKDGKDKEGKDKDAKDKEAKDKDGKDKEGKEKDKDKEEKLDRKGSGDESNKTPAKVDKPLPKLDKDLHVPTPVPTPPPPTGTSTPRRPGTLGLDKLSLEGLGIGLSTPTRGFPLQSPTDDRVSPWDDGHHPHGPALRPPSGMAPGPKGWSAMLEEWLCAGPRTNVPTTTVTNASGSTPNPTPHLTPKSSGNSHTPTTTGATSLVPPNNDGVPTITMSPVEMSSTPPPWSMGAAEAALAATPPPSKPSTPIKSASTPNKVTPSKAITIPGALAAPTPTYARSPLSSFEPASFASTAGTSVGMSSTMPPAPGASLSTPSPISIAARSRLTPPISTGSEREMSRSPSQRSDRSERLETTPDRPRREPGTGPYVNIAKERLLGLYLSVFVYRGCEHLVKGVDKDYVTTGLAGGRFGNKGGIGVSMNLAGHRLLFVNSHLAAHAERNDARLANIAKIKAELNLDCFLDGDDPRAMMEDITDRFDTTFWCGDLNFRVDISLLHAKWLLEQKKYHEALMFDQLKKAMEDPLANPFPGFEEAPITFMPTFKYDVWKSMRATNRDIRRSLRRRRNPVERPSTEIAGSPAGGLEFVPEGDGPEDSGSDKDKGKSSCGEDDKALSEALSEGDKATSEGDHRRREPDTPSVLMASEYLSESNDCPIPDGASTRSAKSGRSVRSSLYADMSASLAQSFTDTDPRLSSDFSVRRSSMSFSKSPLGNEIPPEGFGPRPKGLKEKTKKLLGILALGRRPPSRASARASSSKDDSSRRMSMTSFRSVALSDAGSHMSTLSSEDPMSPMHDDLPRRGREIAERGESGNKAKERTASNRSEKDRPERHARRASNASSKLLASPPRRHLSILRRPSTGHVPHGSVPSGSVEEEYAFDLEDFDDTKDHRVGVYDTSKKQRVPSWCDRVLYKTHIQPDEDEEDLDDDEGSRLEVPGRLMRLSNALSSFSGHFRRRSTVFEPTSADSNISGLPSRLDETLNGSPRRISTDFTERLTPKRQRNSLPGPGNEPSTEEFQPRSLQSRSITFEGPPPATANSPATPRTQRHSSGASGDFWPRRTSSTSVDSSLSRRASQNGRASISSKHGSGPSSRRNDTVGAQMSNLTHIKSTGHSLGDTRRRSQEPMPHLHAVRTDEQGRPRGNSISTASPPSQSMNMFTRFLRDLPGRFHSRVSLFHGSDHEQEEEGKAPQRDRHLAGEVEVLHYGTIDDAGMRQLEGRSDHRPAIFAAAIYV